MSEHPNGAAAQSAKTTPSQQPPASPAAAATRITAGIAEGAPNYGSFSRAPLTAPSRAPMGRHPLETLNRRVLGALTSGMEAHVAWALRVLAARSHHNEVYLGHAPGLLAALFDRAGDAGGCGASGAAGARGRAQGAQKKPYGTAPARLGSSLGPDRVLCIEDKAETAAVILRNLSFLQDNAQEMAENKHVCEWVVQSLLSCTPHNARGAVTVFANCAAFMRLDAKRCAAAIERATALLDCDDPLVVSESLRALAHLAGVLDNTPAFLSADVSLYKARRSSPLLSAMCGLCADSAVLLVSNMAQHSRERRLALAEEPLLLRQLVSVLPETYSLDESVSHASLALHVAPESRCLGAVGALLRLAVEPEVRDALAVYEPYFLLLAAAESPLSPLLSQLILACNPNPS
eukprot:m51a1_g3710 hypothetical protein (405) ;mRNA; f:436120-438089